MRWHWPWMARCSLGEKVMMESLDITVERMLHSFPPVWAELSWSCDYLILVKQNFACLLCYAVRLCSGLSLWPESSSPSRMRGTLLVPEWKTTLTEKWSPPICTMFTACCQTMSWLLFWCSNCEKPRLIEALRSKRVRDIACGSSHSAAIISNGDLFTWGLGDYGRLGHGDNATQLRPKQVQLLHLFALLFTYTSLHADCPSLSEWARDHINFFCVWFLSHISTAVLMCNTDIGILSVRPSVCLFVCPSVCLSCSYIVSKQRNILS